MGVFYQNNDITALKRSVDSILNQTYRNFELLICDDGSCDEVIHYLDAVAEWDSRIHLIREKKLFTLPCKLNACLQIARGELIARMDDDDYSHPNRFETQVKYLAEHPEIGFVGCCVNLICNEHKVGIRSLPKFPTVQDFYMVQPYIHPTVIFRTQPVRQVGGYSLEKTCILCEDYDLFLRLYQQGYGGANIQEILFDYTIPETGKGKRKMRHRWNESVTRFRRFRDLGILPRALPYVVKPVLVGLIPANWLEKIKKRRNNA